MSALVTPSISLLRPYEAGKPVEELARERGVTDAVKLASNENPHGPSPKAVEAMRGVLDGVSRYPDANAFRLRERLASDFGVRMAEVVQGNGSNELLDLIVRTFTTPSDHIVFAEPSFVVYRLAALAHGVEFTAVPLVNDVHDLDGMAKSITPKTRVVFVANPNNPTGTHVGRAALERFLREVPPHVVVALDEAYAEYADAPDYASALSMRKLRERLVVLRTFSKIYGLAALRVGYAISTAEICDYLNRVRAPFNVSSLGQAAALAALDDKGHVERSRSENRTERARLAAALEQLGLRVTPSQANFVYARVGKPAKDVYEALLDRGVIVRAFGGLPDHLRITVGTARENDRLLAALREVLS
ncbi:MAG TPA: histidinol-phosphate transaminase [Polyangiaceae bacterium]|jgi:histidinol-phosphate aminotransferase|nr:histidinol-phosphate transaminase [Polyangiaceae bacterium]